MKKTEFVAEFKKHVKALCLPNVGEHILSLLKEDISNPLSFILEILSYYVGAIETHDLACIWDNYAGEWRDFD